MPPRSSKRSAAAAAAAATKAKIEAEEEEEEVVVDAPTTEEDDDAPLPPAEEEDVEVKDPLTEQHVDQEAALEAAEAAIGNVLDDVNVDADDEGVDATGEGDDEEDEVAMAAAAAAAAVDASDGMAVVVDQALLATAAAAAASQVAKLLSEQPEGSEGLPQDVFPVNKGGGVEDIGEDGDLLEARRVKDRKRYSAMTPEARSSYNAHRRELYHKQGEAARKRRRERERDRYHSLEGENKKQRNERRAKLERDRYNKLDKEELAARNLRRRERAKARKSLTKTLAAGGSGATTTGGEEDVKIEHPDYAMEDVAMADASALAAEVAEQVIANSNLDASSSVVQALLEEGPTVQI